MKKNILAVLFIVGAVFLFWWEPLFMGRIPVIEDPGHLYEDFLSFIPALKLVSHMLWSGHPPLWSPYSQAGMVLFADPQYSIAYPLNTICYLLPVQLHFTVVMLAHMLIGAVSLYFLMLRLKVTPSAAVISAFVYVFSFPVVFGFLLINAAWAWHWLPLILLMIVSYIETGKRIYLYLLAIVWGLQVFTYIQSTYIMTLLLVPFTIISILSCGGARKGRRKRSLHRVLYLLISVCIGTCTTAALLVPLWEYRGLGSYQPFSLQEATIASLQVNLVLESLLSGRPWDSYFAANWVTTFYMGAVGVALALYALFRSPRRKIVGFFAAASAIAVLLALGDRSKLYYIFYHWFPGADLFHAPIRFLWILPISLSIMAGFGMDKLLSIDRSEKKTPDYFFFGSVFILLLLLYVARKSHTGIAHHVYISLQALHTLIPISFCITVIIFARLRGLLTRILTVLALLFIVIAESYSNFAHLDFMDFKEKYTEPETVRFLKENAGLSRFFSLNQDLTNYAVTFPREDSVPMIYPELSNYFRLYGVQARGPLRIERYDRLIKAINRKQESFRERGAYQAEIRDYLSPMIDLFGVKYIVSKGELRVPDEAIFEDWWEKAVRKGRPVRLEAGRTVTTQKIILKSFLENAPRAEQGEAVAEMTLWLGGEKVASLPVRAGVHTSEVFFRDATPGGEESGHAQIERWDTWDETDWYGNSKTGAHYRGAVDLGGVKKFDAVEFENTCARGFLSLLSVLYQPEQYEKIQEEINTRFVPVFRDRENGIIIYENRNVLPRAFLVDDFEVAESGDDALDRLVDPSFKVSERVILEEEPEGLPSRTAERSAPGGAVEITAYTPNRIEMHTDYPEGSFLLLSDVFYPGWVTAVDGRRTKTLRADYAFRAAYVPPGEHEIIMRFRPRSLIIGELISSVSVIVILSGLAAELMRGRRRRQAKVPPRSP